MNHFAAALDAIDNAEPVTDAERAEHRRLVERQKVRETIGGKWGGALGLWDTLEGKAE